MPGGESLAGDAATPALFAGLLARLIESAPPVEAVPSLDPAPPWVGWGHGGAGTWPRPDDLEVDLNDHAGPSWVDALGGRLRNRLSASRAGAIVGHVDWESHNIRWRGRTPVSVDDWDSVATLSEPAIAGAAAAVFPATPDGRTVAADVEQTAAFLDAYQEARDIDWTADELEIGWAAGMWVLAYNAKKEARGAGRGYLEHLGRELRERMRRAGL